MTRTTKPTKRPAPPTGSKGISPQHFMSLIILANEYLEIPPEQNKIWLESEDLSGAVNEVMEFLKRECKPVELEKIQKKMNKFYVKK